MRTLLLSDIFPPTHGGSGRWFWEIFRRLPRDRFTLLVGAHPRQTEFDARHELDIIRAPLSLSEWGVKRWAGLRGYGRLLRLVRSVVRDRRVDRIHCGRCLPEGWVAWLTKKLLRVPYDCYVHGEDIETAATSRELSWMVRRVLRSADRLIANSHNTARLLRENWNVPAGRVVVLHPGVDASRFRPAEPSGEVRQRLGWIGRTVVLTVGRLQKRKGHDTLIRSLPAIREVLPDVLYAVVGDGEERDALRRLAGEVGVTDQVQFLGEIDDETTIDCYQQCDLFALPNRQVGRDIEGFGIVLLEAQACGKPVLAGDSGGTAEAMRVGDTGIVVPCESPGPLGEALVKLLLDPFHLAQMGRAGREWAVRFDWDSLARKAAFLFSTPPEKPGQSSPVASQAPSST